MNDLMIRVVPTSSRVPAGKAIDISDSSKNFYVVLTNTSEKPIRLWREWCSFGYFNLHFEVAGSGGAIVKIEKKEKEWDKNYPDWTILFPGDSLVREVTFDKATWINSPNISPGNNQAVRLKAAFEIKENSETKAHGVWTGRVDSPEETYTIYR